MSLLVAAFSGQTHYVYGRRIALAGALNPVAFPIEPFSDFFLENILLSYRVLAPLGVQSTGAVGVLLAGPDGKVFNRVPLETSLVSGGIANNGYMDFQAYIGMLYPKNSVIQLRIDTAIVGNPDSISLGLHGVHDV